MIENTGRMMSAMRISIAIRLQRAAANGRRGGRASEDVLREVVVAGDAGELRLDERGVDRNRLAGATCRVVRDVLEESLHHRVQPSCADVLLALVHRKGDLGEAPDAVLGELEAHVLGREQRL